MAAESTKKRVAFLSVTGTCLLMVLGVVVYRSAFSMPSKGDLNDELTGLQITPNEQLTVSTGDSLTLTAEGDFSTTTMPINAVWSIVKGESVGTLGNCDNKKTCTFTAGDESGEATIRAEASAQADDVTITVEMTLTNPFKDNLPPWALQAVVKLYRLGIVTGYQNGKYGPADPVTRGQITTLLYRILRSTNSIEEPTDCAGTYTDIAEDHYAFLPTCLFKQQGWSADTATFQPDAPASRGVTAAFLSRSVGESLLNAMGATLEEKQYFDDVPLNHPFYRDTAASNVTGLMTGYPNGDFGVKNTLNRAEAAVVVYRTLRKIQRPLMPIDTTHSAASESEVSSASSTDKQTSSESASCVTEGCDDGNGCTIDACDPEDGCVFQNESSDTLCDDGNSETINDRCSEGECVGTEPAKSSSSSSVAQNLCENKDCGSGNQCVDDSCNPATGTCAHAPKPAGTPCDDTNSATVNDACNGAGECLGKAEVLSCATIKTQSFASATNGTVTTYVKDYGVYVCTAGNDTSVEVEPKYGGANFPAMAGDNLVYFRNYGIVLYNVKTQQKTELEAAYSGSNYPAIGGKFVAYFRNYGIVAYNIETKQKTQVEQPNSGCNNPKINGATLTYSCNYQQKTYQLQ